MNMISIEITDSTHYFFFIIIFDLNNFKFINYYRYLYNIQMKGGYVDLIQRI